jgi:hypothetical protein
MVSAITSATSRRAPIRRAESVDDEAETDAIVAAAPPVFRLPVCVVAFLTCLVGLGVVRRLACCAEGRGAGGGVTTGVWTTAGGRVTGAAGAGDGGGGAGGGGGATCLDVVTVRGVDVVC